jgi:hypothetical protein
MIPGQDDPALSNLLISGQASLQAVSQAPKVPAGGVSCTICGAETEGGNALCAYCEKLIAEQAGKDD